MTDEEVEYMSKVHPSLPLRLPKRVLGPIVVGSD